MPHLPARRNRSRLSWAWLLAFAVWLPAAQWAAATHTLLHLHASVSDQRELPAHLPDACETCVVAAALGAAAPAPGPAAALLARAPEAQPQAASTPAAAPAAPAPYRSRAPPSLPA